MAKRDCAKLLLLSQDEIDRIHAKMEEAGIRNMSAYLRKMALDGICVKLELEDVRELISLLRRCSNNLNQYAKKANETGSIYAEDIADIQKQQDKLWEAMKEILARLATIQ